MTNGHPGYWALEKTWAESMFARAITSQRNGAKAIAPMRGRLGATANVRNGVAVIDIGGVICRTASADWADIQQIEHSAITSALDVALADESVRAICLRIDSPGGSVAGMSDLITRVKAAAAQKPMHAHVGALCASAGYWIASCAATISASADAMIGSVGVLLSVTDFSQMLSNLGIKVHAITTGEHKGTGMPGTPLTDVQKGGLQTLVDDIGALFRGAVSAGRNLTGSRLDAVCTGQLFIAQAAKQNGLIDYIENESTCITRISGGSGRVALTAGNISTERDLAMASPNHNSAELIAERSRVSSILAAFGDNDFSRAQIASGASLSEAKSAAFDAGHVANTGSVRMPGGEGLGGHAGGSSAYNGEGFSELVRAEMDRGLSQPEACRIVAKRNPQAHQAYLLETNPSPAAQAAIRERFAERGVGV